MRGPSCRQWMSRAGRPLLALRTRWRSGRHLEVHPKNFGCGWRDGRSWQVELLLALLLGSSLGQRVAVVVDQLLGHLDGIGVGALLGIEHPVGHDLHVKNSVLADSQRYPDSLPPNKD